MDHVPATPGAVTLMTRITRETLDAYLDDALTDGEASRVEQALRTDPTLRDHLTALLKQRDRGEHSIGAVWRRHRLSCPSREKLGSFRLGVLDDEEIDYIEFHLKVIACQYCQANLDDILAELEEETPVIEERRRRFFESSAGFLRSSDD
jgi:hypothetical protein